MCDGVQASTASSSRPSWVTTYETSGNSRTVLRNSLAISLAARAKGRSASGPAATARPRRGPAGNPGRPCVPRTTDARRRPRRRPQIREHGPIEQAGQRGAVAAAQPFQRLVVKRGARLAEREVGEARNQRERAQQRAEQRISHGVGHRREQRGLAALEREQRQIGGDDDQGREEDRPRHLPGRGPDVLLGQLLGRASPRAGAGCSPSPRSRRRR